MGLLWLLRPLAYFTVPFGLLASASTSQDIPPVVRYYLRAGLYLVTMGMVALSSALVAVPLNIAGQRFNVNWVVARTFYTVASRVMNITVEIEGEEYLEERPAILVCNHQSMVDILFVGKQVYNKPSIIPI
jgi:lysophosphatidate acyltransferase